MNYLRTFTISLCILNYVSFTTAMESSSYQQETAVRTHNAYVDQLKNQMAKDKVNCQLKEAIGKNDLLGVEESLAAGADANFLFMGPFYGTKVKDPEILKVLQLAGADIDAVISFGLTPLLCATGQAKNTTLQTLLSGNPQLAIGSIAPTKGELENEYAVPPVKAFPALQSTAFHMAAFLDRRDRQNYNPYNDFVTRTKQILLHHCLFPSANPSTLRIALNALKKVSPELYKLRYGLILPHLAEMVNGQQIMIMLHSCPQAQTVAAVILKQRSLKLQTLLELRNVDLMTAGDMEASYLAIQSYEHLTPLLKPTGLNEELIQFIEAVKINTLANVPNSNRFKAASSRVKHYNRTQKSPKSNCILQ